MEAAAAEAVPCGTTLTKSKTINIFLTESSRKGGSSCAGAAADC